MANDHEHVFVEEQEPSGRLVLPPCIVCDLTAMDAIFQLREERDSARDRGAADAVESWCQALRRRA
jgi:hypothetical protein